MGRGRCLDAAVDIGMGHNGEAHLLASAWKGVQEDHVVALARQGSEIRATS